MVRAKFQVSEELAPGVNRAKYGYFKVGDVFEWPLNAKEGDNPSLKLIPMNEEATALLVATCKAKIADKHLAKDAAADLLEKIQTVEASGTKYHAWLAGEREAAKATPPPEDKPPSLAPGEVKVEGFAPDKAKPKRTSDSK